ncbi:HNH endonuclease [Clostridium baratii]
MPENIQLCLNNGCLVGDTLVKTKEGLKEIREIKVGDLVLSKNEELGITEYKKVTEIHKNSSYESCIIKTQNSIIEATTGHLFMIKDRWWTAAIDINENDYIELSNGTYEEIIEVNYRENKYLVKVYNLTVEDNHNYYIGKEKLLTHNTLKLKKNCKKTINKIETDIPTAFKQKEFASSYEARISQTPAEMNIKAVFEGMRGESLCTLKPPPDSQLKKIFDEFGVEGIQYKNGVPDFSPVSKIELEINYMVGGKGKMGTKSRNMNFAQADKKLLEKLNNSPELAQKFDMDVGKITEKDIQNFRKKNKLTWHELNDCKTMQLVPSKINSTFGHLGGIGEVNAGAFEPGGFANK